MLDLPRPDTLQAPGRQPAKGTHLTVEREYDSQLAHTIWELERAVKRGPADETLRRSLVEAHAQHLRHMEDFAEVPRHQRSVLYLQPHPTDSVLLLPNELTGVDDVQPLADLLHRRGLSVLATNLAFRTIDQPGHSPQFWQTVADEAQNRYDMLAHFATNISIVGVGLGAVVALHTASTRRVAGVVALFPTLGSEPTWLDKLRASVRRLILRDQSTPRGWSHQRQEAAQAGRDLTATSSVPLYLLVDGREDRSEAGRAARVAKKLVNRAATQVRSLRPGEAASVRDLPPAVQDEILAFLRRR